MGLLDHVQSSKRKKKRRTLIYGPHGIGKSTWATQWPKPIVINTEDGIADLDVPAFPQATDATDLWKCIGELAKEKHEYETLVIDSMDWAEHLICEKICGQHGKSSIGEFDYGKGPPMAAAVVRDLLACLSKLCNEADMHIVLVAHSTLTKIERPDSTISREGPKLLSPVSALVQEWADEVLFTDFVTYTRELDEGFNRKRTVAVGGEERKIFTEARAGFVAKNRLGLPPELPLDFEAYSEFLL